MDSIQGLPEVSKDSGGEKIIAATRNVSIPTDPYANVKRELSDEELSSPAVQKLLLNDNYRMEREIEELKIVESKFYQRDKDAAVLEVKLKEATASEVLYTVCETMGSLLAGLSSLYWENRGWWILIVGIGLVIGGIVFKIVKK